MTTKVSDEPACGHRKSDIYPGECIFHCLPRQIEATPLPWLVPDCDFEEVQSGDGMLIADTCGNGRHVYPKPIREANAALIVRAVNQSPAYEVMYDALKLWMDNARFFAPDSIEYNLAWDQAMAALALADKLKGQ